jgi:hypothetical protein
MSSMLPSASILENLTSSMSVLNSLRQGLTWICSPVSVGQVGMLGAMNSTSFQCAVGFSPTSLVCLLQSGDVERN